ncbi:MAG: ATP-binding protein [Ilumatobacteraceae bacterium]
MAHEAEAFGEATIHPATDVEVAALVATSLGSSVGLAVGRLSRAGVDATLKASGFSRHTFLCGQSGSGKTYSLGALLERMLLETDLPLVIIDPNSDYVGLGSLRSRAEINRARRTPLSVAAYTTLKAEYEARAGVVVARADGGDLPLRIHLSDLTLAEQALTLDLDPMVNADEYAAYAEATQALARDRYSISDVTEVLARRFDEASRRLAQRIHNLRIGNWRVWAGVDEPSLVDLGLGRRCLILDTGSLSDARERSVVALALLGRLRRRPTRQPISVVIDEAHNVCSPDAHTGLERAVADHTVWIAGEGRKFGIYLVLSTQRPQKVHRNVISQCDNLLLMRVNSVADLDELASVFSHVPRSMVAEARSFQLGEMLAAGPIATTPMRLRMGERWSPEGGADLPTTWAAPHQPGGPR